MPEPRMKHIAQPRISLLGRGDRNVALRHKLMLGVIGAMLAVFLPSCTADKHPKMAKVHWNAKVDAGEPGSQTVPGTQHDVDFMMKDSKRFVDSGGWGYGAFEYDAASNTFTPATLKDKHHGETMPNAGSRATRQ